MNGIGIWGLGNSDVLVEGNEFTRVEQAITYDYFKGLSEADLRKTEHKDFTSYSK